MQLLGCLTAPSAGTLKVNGRNLNTLPESLVGRRLAYLDQAIPLFTVIASDNPCTD